MHYEAYVGVTAFKKQDVGKIALDGGFPLNISLLPYKLKRIVGSNNFSAQLIKIISHYKKWL